MNERHDLYKLELSSVERGSIISGVEELLLRTDAGDIVARYHHAEDHDRGVLWVGGAGGGLDGPAGGLYSRLAGPLVDDGIASLRLHYRYPNDLIDCVLDTLIGIEYLKLRRKRRLVLVGHSFGGSVVINAGAASDAVAGVAALSSQTRGADDIAAISPRPVLLIHGADDEVLPESCSHYLFARAREPKRLISYPGCGHALDECREDVDRDLLGWVRMVLALDGEHHGG